MCYEEEYVEGGSRCSMFTWSFNRSFSLDNRKSCPAKSLSLMWLQCAKGC